MEAATEAQALVDRIRAGVAAVDPKAWSLERADVVYINEQAGVELQWLQRQTEGVCRFGLLATLAELQALANSNGGHFGLSDLHLMFEEPHGGDSLFGSRHWFTSTEPFRYA